MDDKKKNDNPLRGGIRVQRTAEPCSVVLFGASGDLARRKLVPSLFSLWQKNLLPPGFSVIGNARTKMTDDAFRGVMRDAIREFAPEELNESAWQSFAQGLFYVAGAAQDDGMFKRLESMLAKIESERH